MTKDELIAAAKLKANQHGLFPELVCAIVEQESNWNTWAVRYEPAFSVMSISWGLMQVMGQVAREHGYQGPLPQLCDPWTGLDVGCKVLAHKLAMAEGNTEKALLLWNSGGNSAYPAQVLAKTNSYK